MAVPEKIIRTLEWPGRFAWRWPTGKPLDGVPRTDATSLVPGTAELDRETAPKPARSLLAEIGGDIAQVREEFELRRLARRVDSERQTGPDEGERDVAGPEPDS